MSRSRKSSSRGRSHKNGGGGVIGKFFFAIFLLGAIVAIYDIPYDPGVKGVVNIAIAKSKNAEAWATNIGPNIADRITRIFTGGSKEPDIDTGKLGGNGATWDKDNGNSTGTADKPKPPAPPLDTKPSAADKIQVGSTQKVDYNRDEWSHWKSLRTCWDVRKEVLVRDSVPGTVVLHDKNGKETKDINKACTVVSGKWIDPYSGTTITDPKTIDIDHVVPLKYAATHGGQGWNAKKKEEFANDLSYSGHLLATSAKENRSKSDKGPSKYQPKDKSYFCAYGTEWTTIVTKWGLKVPEADKKTIKSMLETCK